MRVAKTSGLQTTRYVNSTLGLSSVLQEVTGPAHAPIATTRVPGVGEYDPSKAGTPNDWAYVHGDAQNNRALTNSAAQVGKWWDYDAWGTIRAESGPQDSSFDYAGEQRDDEVGLIFLRSRYYHPGLGRFVSRDSYGGQDFSPQSWNRYAYTENDQVNSIDPDGHKRKKIKWANGADPDDDDRGRKRAKACRNPGQYTGSCKGGPPNRAYAADGEAEHAAKMAGQAANAGNLAQAAAQAVAAAQFATLAATPAAYTAALQAAVTVVAALRPAQAAQRVDNRTPQVSDWQLHLCATCMSDDPGPPGSALDPAMGNPIVIPSEDDGSDCTMEGFGGSGMNAACLGMIFLAEGQAFQVTQIGLVTVNVGVPMASPPGDGGGGGGPGEIDHDAILEKAAAWKGGTKGPTIATVTRGQADRLGERWVGANPKRFSSPGGQFVTLRSADGSRQYRAPAYKPGQGAIQANLEWRGPGMPPGSNWHNTHLDIIPGP